MLTSLWLNIREQGSEGMKGLAGILIAVALLFASAPLRADETAPAAVPSEATLPPAIQKMKDRGGTVYFLGHSYGVDGWRITKDNDETKSMYVYVTPEGGVLMGILLRPDGTNETGAQIEALRAKMGGGQAAVPGADKSSALKTERLYAEIEKAGWVRAGDDKAPYIYVFMNTLCDHCQEFWKELQDPIKSGKLQVRLVPFGQVEDNRLSGAALLSVDNPAAAWDAFIGGDKSALSKDKIKDGMLARIDANTALFRDWKLQGPPFTLYRKPSDGTLAAMVGKPDNTLLLLADVMKEAK